MTAINNKGMSQMPAIPAIILGTRPEIIKMAPIAAELSHLNLPFQLIHTGQHYSRNMSEIFLRELGMPPLTHFLNIGKGTSSQQLAKCLIGLEKLFLGSPPPPSSSKATPTPS
jgi:UDP-N-acetylglucosamine 2-epimerase (non-hydrolysing)